MHLPMNFFLITLFGFFLAVQASPLFVPRNKLDVWVPTITNPKQNTVWHIGASETVTWDNSNPPKTITNGASITLHKPDIALPAVILAEFFNLRSGSQVVTVPDFIIPGEYQITLFGDSGNFSAKITIVA